MNDSTDYGERSDDVLMVDLGNAKVETKQFHPVQLVPDSQMKLGWGSGVEREC